MRVWLASYPRSGNTFFRLILADRFGLASATSKPMPENWEKLWRLDPAHRPNTDDAPTFTKTHGLPGDDADPAIYIVRDGRDALVSHAHFILAFNRKAPTPVATPERFRNTLRELIVGGASASGSWGKHVETWLTRANTAMVRYEDLVADPTAAADRALASIGLRLTPIADAITPFEELRNVDPKFFRRGGVGAHLDEFPPDLLDLFWNTYGETMTRLGYTRESPRKVA
jgi:hypothetical protein